MNVQLAHEWLRELEREIEEAAAARQRELAELEQKMAACVGQQVRVRLPADFKIR